MLSCMVEVYAEWHAGPPIVRKDTRVYFVPSKSGYIQDDASNRCIGIVWMCNPGSQKPNPKTRSWCRWPGTPDSTMQAVARILDAAQKLALHNRRGALQ